MAAPEGPRRSRDVVSLLIFAASTLVFWFLRERSFSGDSREWIHFVEKEELYTLREPLSPACFTLAYRLLRPLGVDAQGLLAGFSYVCGGLSMALAYATLVRLTPSPGRRALGLAAIGASYGITGIFFGHIEHYMLMSLGCFAYVYYAIRYLRGECGIVGASVSFGVLFATHLMSAWMFPSLLVLAWLGAKRRGIGPVRESILAVVAFSVPVAIGWGWITATYYDWNPFHVVEDAITGKYSKERTGVANAVGGEDLQVFHGLSTILSWKHQKSIFYLYCLFSPFCVGVLAVSFLTGARATARGLWASADAKFFLSLTIPYAIYVDTFQAGLGYAYDWDLFSHVTVFLAFSVLVLLFEEERWSAVRKGTITVSLAATVALSGYLVLQTHRPDDETGIYNALEFLGLELRERPHLKAFMEQQGARKPPASRPRR